MNQRTSSSCFGEQVLVVHVRDSFVVNESVATDPSPNAHQWAPTPALNSLWPFQTQLSIRCVVFSESTIREYCRDHVVGRQMIQLLVCSRRKWTGGFFILAWHFLRVRDSVRLMVKAWESRQGRDCWQPCLPFLEKVGLLPFNSELDHEIRNCILPKSSHIKGRTYIGLNLMLKYLHLKTYHTFI